MDDLVLTTVAQRPEYATRLGEAAAHAWPHFMMQDLVAEVLLGQLVTAFPELQLIATTADGRPVARARAVPFALAHRSPAGTLPANGWDQVLIWGMRDHADGRPADRVSALEIAIDDAYLGVGLSGRMLQALRGAALEAGFDELVAPVRPNHKHRHPRMPMSQYVATTRADGLPIDPWLRVHVRAGGVIDAVAPASMVFAGSLAEWRDWTGLPFAASGPIEVPEALVPVHCDLEQDHAVYVEPNVWVRHRLS